MLQKISNSRQVITIGSIILSILILFASSTSFTNHNIYAAETINWRDQSIAQDIFNIIFLVPTILISAWLVFKNRTKFFYTLLGGLFYSIYTYFIYSFSLHFGILFPVYVFILGLSFYLSTFLIFNQNKSLTAISVPNQKTNAITAWALIIFGVLFYFLWGSEIVTNLISHTLPQSLIDTGLVTNPIHILDMAFLLPAMIISGWLLKQKNKYGNLFAPSILTTKTLFSLTIVLINLKYLPTSPDVIPMIFVFSTILVLDLIILVNYLIKAK